MGGRVAIRALEARSALAEDLEGTWRALLEGRSAVSPVTGFDASGFGAPCAAQVFAEPATGEDDPVLRILGRHGQLLAGAIHDVHGRGRADLVPRDRLGLFVAMGVVDSVPEDLAPAVVASRDRAGRLDLGAFFAGAYRQVHPLWPLAMLNNVAAGQIAIDLDVRGDNAVFSSDATAGVRALLEGRAALLEGHADAVLAGGVSECVSPFLLARLALRALLADGPARPLAAGGTGCSPGEAAAAFLLARAEPGDARPPSALLLGGATAFGKAPGRPGPTREAFEEVIRRSLDSAGCPGGEVDAVFLHAEGRAGEDEAELLAVSSVLGDAPRLVALKGALGQTGSAAPALESAIAVRALAAGTLPPSVTTGALLDGVSGRLVRMPETRALRRILLLAAGAEGGAGAWLVGAP